MESRIVQEFNYFQINTLPRFKVYNSMVTVRGEIYEDRSSVCETAPLLYSVVFS